MRKTIAVATFTLAAVSVTAFAGELENKRAWDEVTNTMTEWKDKEAKQCGKDVPYTLDRASFDGQDLKFLKSETRGPAICSEIHRRMWQLCTNDDREDDVKEAIRKKVKAISCRYEMPKSAKGKKSDRRDEGSVKLLKNGTLEFVISYHQELVGQYDVYASTGFDSNWFAHNL